MRIASVDGKPRKSCSRDEKIKIRSPVVDYPKMILQIEEQLHRWAKWYPVDDVRPRKMLWNILAVKEIGLLSFPPSLCISFTLSTRTMPWKRRNISILPRIHHLTPPMMTMMVELHFDITIGFCGLPIHNSSSIVPLSGRHSVNVPQCMHMILLLFSCMTSYK